MKLLPAIASMFALSISLASAEESSRAADANEEIAALQGQWKFLNFSTKFCEERVPAMKRDLGSARERAQAEMLKAEAIILEEVAGNRQDGKRLLGMYEEIWRKHSDELAAAMEKQDPLKACPVLLSNWQEANVDLILEDWRTFVEREQAR